MLRSKGDNSERYSCFHSRCIGWLDPLESILCQEKHRFSLSIRMARPLSWVIFGYDLKLIITMQGSWEVPVVDSWWIRLKSISRRVNRFEAESVVLSGGCSRLSSEFPLEFLTHSRLLASIAIDQVYACLFSLIDSCLQMIRCTRTSNSR